MIADPPPFTGAVHDSEAPPFAAVAVTPIGTPGTADDAVGVTGCDQLDAAAVPDDRIGVTRKTYDAPFVNPVTVIDVVVDTGWLNAYAVRPPSEETSTL